MKTTIKRSEADPHYMWNMKDMYESDGLWEEDLKKAYAETDKLKKYKDMKEIGKEDLFALIELNAELDCRIEKIYVYASQKSHEDMAEGRYQDMASRAQSLMVAKDTEASFIEPLLMNTGQEKIEAYCKEMAELKKYERYFEIVFRQKEHILDSDIEELLAGVSEIAEAPSDIFAMFNNADIKFPDIYDENNEKVPLTHGRYNLFLQSRDRNVRRNAFESMYAVYTAHKNTLAAVFRANVKKHCFFAKARKYESGMHYSLSDANIPVRVYEKLIEAVHDNIGLLHRYIRIRKETLNLSELHMYDLYVPMVRNVDMKIDYEEAKKIVSNGLAPLGEEYQSLLQKGFDEGWIDVYENEGKRSGAYSWGAYGVHPYVLLNHQDNLNSVFTLAHEMGHALHSYYSDKNQPYIYAGYKIFVAEVASTCNEALLVNYMIDNVSGKDEKKYLINYFLEQFRTTFFRQAMFAEFEKITHEMCMNGETLTPEVLCEIYRKLNAYYFGEDAVIDEQIAMEWARIPHFYTPFYVYQYATGFAAAISISSGILKGDMNVIEGYKKFLKSGNFIDPVELLKLCGVDMLTAEPVNCAMEMFKKLMDQFEE